MNGTQAETCPEERQHVEGDTITSSANKTSSVHRDSLEQSRPENHIIIADALSNFVVLRNIFTILDDEDLETCCHVSQYWRTVADPMVFLHYDVQLGKDLNFDEENLDPWETDDVVIKARARYNRKSFSEYESNFQGVTQTLEQVLLTQNVSISLTVSPTIDIRSDRVKTFFSKFGPLVLDLSFVGETTLLPLKLFCKLLLNSLPNLRNLSCAGLDFEDEDSPEDQNFNVDLPKNKHKQLRKISFKEYASCSPCSFQSFATILKFAQNLVEIHRLPLQLINSVVIAQKGQVLKTLGYQTDEPWLLIENGEEVVTAFQKVAQLQPKLTSFDLLASAFPVEDDNSFERIKPLIFSTLKSSSQSLESLYITPTEFYGFQNFPRLEALKTLEFSGLDSHSYEGLFFPEEISLTEIFPNVSEISFLHFDIRENLMERYFPESIISPWGSQIKVLKVGWLELNSWPLLQRRFPSIQELKFRHSANHIGEILPTLAQFWPNLKSLTIEVNFGYGLRRPGENNNDNNVRPGMLDCAFTGLSKEVVNQLLDPSKRENFAVEEIQRFKNESPISKLKELRELKLILKNCLVVGESVEKLTGLNSAVNEFGFKLLPHLMVTVGIWRNRQFAEVIKTALQPWAESDNIQIEDYYFDGAWKM